MKNLHLIPTDKPSSLFKVSNELKLTRKYDFYNGAKYQNIYITSDEEIKEGDKWIYNIHWNKPKKIKEDWVLKILNESSNTFKIILTTDQDLIKDGVQAIDDEFLEWFVKNPTCEEVDLDTFSMGNKVLYNVVFPQEEPCSFCKGTGQIVSSTTISGFKTCDCINIPQEEPIQELNLNCFDCNKSLQDCTCIEDTINMKQETLEEAANHYVKGFEYNQLSEHGLFVNSFQGFIAGAKWQSDRMYSEEEVLELVLSRPGPYLTEEETKEWFAKYKKK
jgi:hypothetical protein